MKVMRFIVLLCLILQAHSMQAQVSGRLFHGGIKAGLNLAQIDGDEVLGYDKWAYHAGLTGGFSLGGIHEIQLEFLYSLRGSRYTRLDTVPAKFSLHYLEIPLIYCLKDWLSDDEKNPYYKVHFQGGLSSGFLFNSSSYNGQDENFNRFDLSWLLGVQFFPRRDLGAYFRYTSSLTPLDRFTKNGREIRMISYFLSLGLNYRFN